jgi:hypothetical protein
MVAEGTYVSAGIALNPEHDQTSCFAKDLKFLDGTDSKDAFHSALSRRALVQSSGELSADSFYPALINIAMQPHYADIFLIVLEEKWSEAHCIA